MKELIQKYWEGETSLEEEKELRTWLKSAPSTTENRQLAQLLSWYDQEATREIPHPVSPKPVAKASTDRKIRPLTWFAGIAAAIALLLAFAKFSQPATPAMESPNLAYVDTYEDPEEALAAAEQALLLLSTKMNATQKHKKKLKKIKILSDLVESYKKD